METLGHLKNVHMFDIMTGVLLACMPIIAERRDEQTMADSPSRIGDIIDCNDEAVVNMLYPAQPVAPLSALSFVDSTSGQLTNYTIRTSSNSGAKKK